MAKKIERVGIPVSIMTAMPAIPLPVGANRVVRGVRVPQPVEVRARSPRR